MTVAMCTLSWWWMLQSAWAQDQAASPTAVAELPSDPAAVLAVVGRTPILMGEIRPKVEQRIAEGLAANWTLGARRNNWPSRESI